MRSLSVLLLLAIGAWAEEPRQDATNDAGRKLADRIEHPNYEKSFEANKGSPVGNRSVSSRGASTKEFSTATFSAKEFSAREYYGSKPANLGKSKVALPEANTKGRYEIPNAGTQAPTKTVGTEQAWDAKKSVDTRSAPTTDRTYVLNGRSQTQLDKEKGSPESSKPLGYVGNLKTLTLGDIRELLNKNK